MYKYQALLVALDGDYKFDYRSKTIDEVLNQLADWGSRWFCYPFEFVVKHPATLRSRIISSPIPVLERKQISTLVTAFKKVCKEYDKGTSIDLTEFVFHICLILQGG